MRLLYCVLCLLSIIVTPTVCSRNRNFSVDYNRNCFLKDGQPYRYISGTIHYFRVPAKYWLDRLTKLKSLGCNVVQTYIMWFWHEPVQRRYVFSGSLNFTRFFALAQQLGLDVILRLGPYSDAEQDMGGFPAWMLKQRQIRYRTSDAQYTRIVKVWWDKLLPMIKPFTYSNGGPIIMVQVENEYGSWPACDHKYTTWLFNLAKSHLGEGIVYFTTDGAQKRMVECGHINGTYATVDFGYGSNLTQVKTIFQVQRIVQPKGPLVNSEFYPGWFTMWGEHYGYTPAAPVIKTMQAMYKVGASFNIYLVHGGTNFGYAAGAEKKSATDKFQTITTSYDWSAPIREDGETIPKFFQMQQAIHQLTKKSIIKPPVPIPRFAYGNIQMKYHGTVFDHLKDLTLGRKVLSRYPMTAEDLDHNYGFLLYEVRLPIAKRIVLNFTDAIHDRGYFFLDRKKLFVTQRDENTTDMVIKFRLKSDQKSYRLSILVENQGRICYTPNLADHKGIVRNITANGVPLAHWTTYRIDFTKYILKMKHKSRSLIRRRSQNHQNQRDQFIPSIFAGYFHADKLGDTWIDTTDWGKGQMFIQSSAFGLGRYWPSKGPQLTLYHPYVQKGINKVIFFEMDKPGRCTRVNTCAAKSVLNPIYSTSSITTP